jgi:hypothetical protein
LGKKIMKPPRIILLLAIMAVLSAGLPADEIKPIKVNMERFYYAATLGKNTEFVFVMGGAAYRSVQELKKGVSGLPRGSEISWAPSCDIIGGEPLHSESETEDFRAHCAAHEVKLVIIPSG